MSGLLNHSDAGSVDLSEIIPTYISLNLAAPKNTPPPMALLDMPFTSDEIKFIDVALEKRNKSVTCYEITLF